MSVCKRLRTMLLQHGQMSLLIQHSDFGVHMQLLNVLSMSTSVRAPLWC
jgi:hypothetical protein